MANVPRLYVPIYILIRVPLLTLFGAALAMISAQLLLRASPSERQQRDIALLALTVIFPLACQVIWHGPAFTGLRHFLFVFPPWRFWQGSASIWCCGAASPRSRGRLRRARGGDGMPALGRGDPGQAASLRIPVLQFPGRRSRGSVTALRSRLLVGSMPEALNQLEAYLRRTEPGNEAWPPRIYSVAVCGERLPFEKASRFRNSTGTSGGMEQSDFFIAPTQMNCDRDLDGKVIGTVERLGVVIAYIKDLRPPNPPETTARR